MYVAFYFMIAYFLLPFNLFISSINALNCPFLLDVNGIVYNPVKFGNFSLQYLPKILQTVKFVKTERKISDIHRLQDIE